MGKARNPRHGSMQFWPRVRAKKETPRVRYFEGSELKPLAFAGYKAGMTHIQFTDGQKTSLTKGETVALPVTILECPPINIIGARSYSQDYTGMKVKGQINASKLPTDVKRRIPISKKESTSTLTAHDVVQVRLIVSTQPKLTGNSKKTPDIFEIPLGGSVEEQIAYATEHLGKTISVSDIFKPGDLIDTHSVTTGRGNQGPVKRFGINLTAKKSEKTKRGPGSLGPWKAQGHIMYRIAYSGQTGYHLRTEFNKRVELISDELDKINPKGGLVRYGNVKTTYILVRGSVGGPKNRLVTLTFAQRPKKQLQGGPIEIEYINQESQQ